MIHAFHVKHVDVTINGQRILRDVTFSLKSGEMLGLVGPNGAGKSTLLKAILGLIPAQKGKVQMSGEHRKAGFGYVPQSRSIDEDLPIRTWDFVSFGLPPSIRPWLTKRDREAIRQALILTKVAHLAKKPVGKLSGGERQRVFLAQALVRDPKILLLDESTANLDPDAQEHMMAMVQSLCQTRAVSAIFISHDVHLVAKYADRVLAISRHYDGVREINDIEDRFAVADIYKQARHDERGRYEFMEV
ncbi:metal ABC transporter ATP-binding protein [Camelliibacillus cellulosilyticus]|uniref:Metal ABC transporter ATP-binding protein n=1 Tax=Camelliibacillus cellulosilyticus TaxID=2174486 RepID=A0ABV9GN44_9BACL